MTWHWKEYLARTSRLTHYQLSNKFKKCRWNSGCMRVLWTVSGLWYVASFSSFTSKMAAAALTMLNLNLFLHFIKWWCSFPSYFLLLRSVTCTTKPADKPCFHLGFQGKSWTLPPSTSQETLFSAHFTWQDKSWNSGALSSLRQKEALSPIFYLNFRGYHLSADYILYQWPTFCSLPEYQIPFALT